MRLALSAVAFGVRRGRHALHRHVRHAFPAGPGYSADRSGLVASPQVLALVLALLCFLIAAGFLLFLVPEPRRREPQPRWPADDDRQPVSATDMLVEALSPDAERALRTHAAPRVARTARRTWPAAQRRRRRGCRSRAPTAPISSTSPKSAACEADAHYTLVHDGTRERMSPWSISQAEAQLDPAFFVRVHRSHIVAIPHVSFVRKEGDGAVVELDGTGTAPRAGEPRQDRGTEGPAGACRTQGAHALTRRQVASTDAVRARKTAFRANFRPS